MIIHDHLRMPFRTRLRSGRRHARMVTKEPMTSNAFSGTTTVESVHLFIHFDKSDGRDDGYADHISH